MEEQDQWEQMRRESMDFYDIPLDVTDRVVHKQFSYIYEAAVIRIQENRIFFGLPQLPELQQVLPPVPAEELEELETGI